MQTNSSIYVPLSISIFFNQIILYHVDLKKKRKKACSLNKHPVTKIQARPSVHCNQAFVTSNFVTVLAESRNVYENNMESLNLDKNGFECGAWINGYFQEKKEKSL